MSGIEEATIAIAHALVFVSALIELLALVIVFARWKSLEDRVPITRAKRKPVSIMLHARSEHSSL